MSTPKSPHSDGNEQTLYQVVVRTNQQETRFRPTDDRKGAENLRDNLKSEYDEENIDIEEVKR